MGINTDLTHLPERKQQIISEIRRIILAEVANSAYQNEWVVWVVWVVLFGSYARGTYLDNPINGYISDYDILVVVKGRALANDLKLWYKIEDQIDRITHSPINLLVHTHEEIAQWLTEGHYFFSDLRREGIYLHTSKPNKGLPQPKSLSNAERLLIAQQRYHQRFASADEFFGYFKVGLTKQQFNSAAFLLHQAAERFYSCTLLVICNYRPHTHNLKNLRNIAVDKTSPASPLTDIFPGTDKFQRRCFERLKRAYIDARYSEHYSITQEELAWLASEVEALKTATQSLCETRIADLMA